MAIAIVASILLYNNLQRSGAVQGMAAEEVRAPEYEERGEHQYITTYMHEHKDDLIQGSRHHY